MTPRPLLTLALTLPGAAVLAALLHPSALTAAPTSTAGTSGAEGEGRFWPRCSVVLEGPGIYASFEADRLFDGFFVEGGGIHDSERVRGTALARPLTLRKRLDGASPSLERALVNGERLRLTIQCADPWGADWTPSARIHLQDAVLIGLRQGLNENVLSDFGAGRGELWEELSLSVHEFEFTWLETGVSARWTAPEPR